MTALFINTSDLMAPGWRFLEPRWTDPAARWAFFHGVPQNRLEAMIWRPNVARYRAALQAALHARAHQPQSILVSHLPAMSAATNLARRCLSPQTRHIAFAFNFTDLPTGRRLSYFRYALRGIDAFVVFSKAERDLYSGTFGIPPERLRMLHWAMDPPVPGPVSPLSSQVPYLCAVGGEGRDYALLAEVMRQLPQVRLAIVARPHSIAGLDFPDNVDVFTNLPAPQTWRMVQDSCGIAIPLKTAQTNCGHITIVGAQLLGVPLIVTRSDGVADYVSDDTAFMTTAGDVAQMCVALETVASGHTSVQKRRHRAQQLAQERSNLTHWVRYFEGVLNG